MFRGGGDLSAPTLANETLNYTTSMFKVIEWKTNLKITAALQQPEQHSTLKGRCEKHGSPQRSFVYLISCFTKLGETVGKKKVQTFGPGSSEVIQVSGCNLPGANFPCSLLGTMSKQTDCQGAAMFRCLARQLARGQLCLDNYVSAHIFRAVELNKIFLPLCTSSPLPPSTLSSPVRFTAQGFG